MARKNTSIIIRTTEKEKEEITKRANKCHKSMSSYILQKCLYTGPESSISLPDKIEITNCMNEIYHTAQKFGNQELVGNITLLYKKLFQ